MLIFDSGDFKMRKFKVVVLSVLMCLFGAVAQALPPVTDGLVIHLDARNLALSDGDPVDVWADVSGGGNDATQDTADYQPTYVSFSEDFSRPVVRFDGTSDWLALPSGEEAPFALDAVTVIINAKFNTIGENNQYIIACNSGSGTDRLRICLDTNAGGFLFRVGTSAWTGIVETETDTDVHAFAATSTAEGFIDGALIGTSANTSTANPSTLNLGSFANGSKDWFDGDIAEVLIYNRVLTVDEITEIGEYFSEGFLPNPSPANFEPLVPVSTDIIGWDVPKVEFTPTKYVLTMRESDPNFIDTDNNIVIDPVNDQNADAVRVETAMPVTLSYGTTYYWRVDVYNGETMYPGSPLQFSTEPLDRSPVVEAGDSFITWQDNLPQMITATVDDSGEGDVADADVQWNIIGYPGDPVKEVAQLIDRGMDSAEALELKDAGYDPNMLAEWIGTDTRTIGDPLVLTISGLPSGSYTWTSTHHDYNDQTGLFDVYVDGVLAGEDIDISTGNELPTQFTTSVTTNGSDLVVIFDKKAYDSESASFFIMNAFEITDGSNELKVDFDNATTSTAPGYVSYRATHEDLTTFTAQSFTFGTGSVTVLPQWGANTAGWINASVNKTSSDPLAPAAELSTDTPGLYTIEISVADTAGHTDSATMEVNVAPDSCAAAQLSGTWPGFNYFDIDQNCVVDIIDFADFAGTWLDDISAVDVEAY